MRLQDKIKHQTIAENTYTAAKREAVRV